MSYWWLIGAFIGGVFGVFLMVALLLVGAKKITLKRAIK